MLHQPTSYLLDAIILLLDAQPPTLVRLALRWYKGKLERSI